MNFIPLFGTYLKTDKLLQFNNNNNNGVYFPSEMYNEIQGSLVTTFK